nr:serine O-acetyltransferase [bacterium]
MSRSSDIAAILQRDPAARSAAEIKLCYPGYKAIRRYRLAHRLWLKGYRTLARYMMARVLQKTGIDIHPGAEIGEGFFIDHGSGVVIGETSIIGKNVTIYQGVTLGGTGKHTGKRHPTIGDNVVIGAGAKVLGPFTVGNGSKIGAGAVVLREVPPNCTVVGNPGRIVKKNQRRVEDIDLDQVNLPDPTLERFEAMQRRIAALEQAVYSKEEG